MIDDYGPYRGAPGDPRTPDDDRDILDLSPDELDAHLRALTKAELIQVVHAAIEAVRQVRGVIE